MADNKLMEEIIDKLSIKYGMSKVAIKAICNSPFRILSRNVKERTFKGVNFNFLGKFAVHEHCKKKLIEYPIEEQRAEYRLKQINRGNESNTIKSDN